LKGFKFSRGQRVLLKTRNSADDWSKKPFNKDFVSIRADAAQFLVEQGVMTVGVDYLSIGGYERDGVQTHQIMLGAGIWVIEGLNLSEVKPGYYNLICLPLKIAGADGAPCRVVIR
jgi:arylformamidase